MVIGLRAFRLPALAALFCATSVPALAQEAPCSDLLPNAIAPAPGRRPVNAEDLVRLRDIGPSLVGDPSQPFQLSPNGAKLAFQIRRANPKTNTYCLGMVVMDARMGAKPILVNRGGEYDLVDRI